ncbi:MAG: peptide ABC transporter substrate-binding protein [Pseudonocardiales bacterium]|nr:MAG: peptide ABC transporter substrate-binding protein [Pseudonocardiales bacterium]
MRRAASSTPFSPKTPRRTLDRVAGSEPECSRARGAALKILVSADMEGATGVTWPADVEPGSPQWQRFRVLFNGDVNAAVAGLFDGGATEVLVNEAHSNMRNLLLEDLDERADLLTGRHKTLSMMEGVDADVDGVVFIGYHAGAGRDGILSHTYLGNSITGVFLDGDPASEGWLNAALADEYGVPVLLVTGDDHTCDDAAAYAPDCQRVAVKKAVSRYAAVCHPPTRTGKLIRAAAVASMARAGHRTGVVRPHRVTVEFDATHLALAATAVPTVERTGARAVGYDAGSMRDAMTCFKTLTYVVDGAIEDGFG